MTSSLLIAIALAVSALVAPQFRPPPAGLGFPAPGQCTCAISTTMSLSTNQTVLAAPTASAVADPYDLSCVSKVPVFFNTIQDQTFGAWKALPPSVKTLGPTTNGYPLIGSHFFVTSPSGTGISPVWDFRAASAKGNANAFVLAAKVANLPVPTGTQDVDWLQLKNVQGALTTQIYCTDTRGGQPPASCVAGLAPISVKYVSKYWLFGSTVKV